MVFQGPIELGFIKDVQGIINHCLNKIFEIIMHEQQMNRKVHVVFETTQVGEAWHEHLTVCLG